MSSPHTCPHHSLTRALPCYVTHTSNCPPGNLIFEGVITAIQCHFPPFNTSRWGATRVSETCLWWSPCSPPYFSKPPVESQHSFQHCVTVIWAPVLLHTPWLKRALFLGPSFIIAWDTKKVSGKPLGMRAHCVTQFRCYVWFLHDPWYGSVGATRLVVPAAARERSTMNRSTDLLHPAVRAESIKRDTWLASKAKRWMEPSRSTMSQCSCNVPSPWQTLGDDSWGNTSRWCSGPRSVATSAVRKKRASNPLTTPSRLGQHPWNDTPVTTQLTSLGSWQQPQSQSTFMHDRDRGPVPRWDWKIQQWCGSCGSVRWICGDKILQWLPQDMARNCSFHWKSCVRIAFDSWSGSRWTAVGWTRLAQPESNSTSKLLWRENWRKKEWEPQVEVSKEGL